MSFALKQSVLCCKGRKGKRQGSASDFAGSWPGWRFGKNPDRVWGCFFPPWPLAKTSEWGAHPIFFMPSVFLYALCFFLYNGLIMKKTAILIPCYNESATIEKVVRDYAEAFPHAEIYVYDNNSSDHTDEIARNAGAIVRYEHKQGKGNVVRSMFRDIDADCYIIVDGDDTYPAEDARKLEKAVLEHGADMAIGDRLSSTYFTENKRLFHNTGNRLVRGLINTFFDSNVRDIMTGLRAFSWDFVKSFPVTSKGFEIETEMTIFALDHNMKLEELPIRYRDRPAGSVSKLNTISDGTKVLYTIGRLLRDTRPFAFFNTIAIILMIIALALFIPIWIEFLNTGLVLKMPTLMIITMIALFAFLNFFTGVILTSLRKSQKTQFEHALTMMRLEHDQDRRLEKAIHDQKKFDKKLSGETEELILENTL